MRPLFRTGNLNLAVPVLLILFAYGCGQKEQVVLPPIKVNVVKAIQNDVPLYEDFVAQVYGESDVDIRTRVEGWVTSVNLQTKSRSRACQGDAVRLPV